MTTTRDPKLPYPPAPMPCPPEPWITDNSVLMLMPKRELAKWRGTENLPDDEKRELIEEYTYWNYSHFGFAHDWARDNPAETMFVRGAQVLLFGYGRTCYTWLPSPTGGTLVQLVNRWHSDWALGREQTYRAVLAGAAEAFYKPEEDLFFKVDDCDHVLRSAGVCGDYPDEGGSDDRRGPTLVHLARGIYEVWSAEMSFLSGEVEGRYVRLSLATPASCAEQERWRMKRLATERKRKEEEAAEAARVATAAASLDPWSALNHLHDLATLHVRDLPEEEHGEASAKVTAAVDLLRSILNERDEKGDPDP